MFFSILLLAFLLGSAEMCGNLVQSNAPSKQSDVGSGEAFAEVTFKDNVAKTCADFKGALDLGVQDMFELCTSTPGTNLKLKITPKDGSCDHAIAIAMNAQKKLATTDYKSATFTCHGSVMNVPAS